MQKNTYALSTFLYHPYYSINFDGFFFVRKYIYLLLFFSHLIFVFQVLHEIENKAETILEERGKIKIPYYYCFKY